MAPMNPGSPVGILVDGHMINLSMPRGGLTTHLQVDWAFSSPILGVMFDSEGNLEAASTFELGEAGAKHTTTSPGNGIRQSTWMSTPRAECAQGRRPPC